MIFRSFTKHFFSSQSNNIPFINTLIKSFSQQLKSGTPQTQAFKSKLPQFTSLNQKQKDAFLRACVNFSRDPKLSFFLKNQGYLSKYPDLVIGCNTKHIIHTLNEFKQKQDLLNESKKLMEGLKDGDQKLTSKRFIEEAFGDLYLPEGKFKEAIGYYLESLKIGNKYFESIVKQYEDLEETIKNQKANSNDPNTINRPNYHYIRLMNVAQNLSQLSTKALFTNTKLNDKQLNQQIILNAIHPYNRFPLLKVKLPSYFLIKKTEFNHRIINNKQTSEKIYNDVLKTMEEILQCLEVIEKTYHIKSLELLGIAAINFTTILNFLNGVKGEEAQENIKEVISTLCQGVTEAKKRDEFEKILNKIANDMKVNK